MTQIDSETFLGLLGLPPKDITELIDIVSAVCHFGKMDISTKMMMAMILMNKGARLFESIGGSTRITNSHSTFKIPIEYQTGDTDKLGENFES